MCGGEGVGGGEGVDFQKDGRAVGGVGGEGGEGGGEGGGGVADGGDDGGGGAEEVEFDEAAADA